MTTSPPLPPQVADLISAQRAQAVRALGGQALLWLAVAPVWSRGAAEAAGFPAQSVPEFIRRARAAGWCEYRGDLDVDPDDPLADDDAAELLFWMPDGVRRDVLDAVTREDSSSRPDLLAQEVAGQVMGTARSLPDEQRPGALRAWASIMMARSPSAALVERARSAAEAGDLPRGQELVAAGNALAPVLSGSAELALDRAKRLLSLTTRRRQDARALGRYLDRPELSEPVARLLSTGAAVESAATDEKWALHLRGAGGVGKTMLIRYLASGRYAADRGMEPIAIARADFDYLTPDYPVRRPVQLLVELADELALHTAASGAADRALASFQSRATDVHDLLSSRRESQGLLVQDPLVESAIDAFAAAIAALPSVLLILDTCEELAKADTGDPSAPAIQATLRIIERLHKAAPNVRVLFAGRRPLQPAPPYLSEQDVTGFTQEEARSYLTSFAARPIAADLIDEMIRQSPAMDGPVPDTGALPQRVSPFDLALYRSWADEDAGLSAADVAAGSDAYIEGRIIDRLGDPLVLSALPILAVSGRCRVPTLAAVLGVDDAASLGARVAEQEWIESDGTPPVHVKARPALARRLRRYFEAPERVAAFAAQTARLAAMLAERVPAAWPDIDVDELLTVLRLLPLADAAALWDDIADRAISDANWNWLLNVTRRVLGESQDEQWPTAAALRASAGAAHIAASRRTSPLFNARGQWRDVLEWARQHPGADAAYELRQRAILGLLPYDSGDESLWRGLTHDRDRKAAVPVLAAAAADTLNRLLEADLADAAERFCRVSASLVAAQAGLAGQKVVACGLIAQARRAADGDLGTALEQLAQAEELALRPATSERSWPDFIPPDDLLARVRIEHGLIAPQSLGTGVLDGWEAYAAQHIDSIDGERLAALCLRIRLETGVVEPAAIERWDALDGYQLDRVPTCSAHDLVPPLFVMRADAWLALGNPERGLTIVGDRRDEAELLRKDEATVRLADEETIRITRRMRLGSQRVLLSRLAGEIDPHPSRLELVDSARRAMAVVHHEPVRAWGAEVTGRPAGWHAWWQSRALDQRDVPGPDWPAERTGTGLAADIELDLFEASRITLPSETFQQLRAVEDESIAAWLARPRPAKPPVRSADPYRDVRAGLRRAAVAGVAYTPRPEVPPRLLAEMAFEEAQLLALRIPAAAIGLFERAAGAFEAAGDLPGRDWAMQESASLKLRDATPVSQPGPSTSNYGVSGIVPAQPVHLKPPASQRQELARQWSPQHPGPASPATPVPGLLVRPRRARRRWWIPFTAALLVAIAGGGVLALVSSSGAPRHRPATAISAVSGATPLGTEEATPATPSESGTAGIPTKTAVQSGSSAPPSTTATTPSATPTGRPQARPATSSGVVTWISIIAAVLAAAGAGWWLRRWHRLRVYRGVGTRPLSRLFFVADVNNIAADADIVIYVGSRFWRTPDELERAVLKRGPFSSWQQQGFWAVGNPLNAPVTWWPRSPTASRRWWRRHGDATNAEIRGATRANRAQYRWERMLTEATGGHAAGRIEWTRIAGPDAPRSFPDNHSIKIAMEAPGEWERTLYFAYGEEGAVALTGASGEPVSVRHAMGRGVTTSAGPRLDIGAARLLGAEDLARDAPRVVILQAEPADVLSEDPRAHRFDDLDEKLALAADLMAAGVPAVLLLPPLAEGMLVDLARVVQRHAAARPREDPRILRRSLRELVRDRVSPVVLDDFVLFVNPGL